MDYVAEHERIKAERKAETRNVKAAVVKAGYQNVGVRHGTGTACAWLMISADHKAGQTWQEAGADITEIAQRVTGRGGAYDGRISTNVRGCPIIEL